MAVPIGFCSPTFGLSPANSISKTNLPQNHPIFPSHRTIHTVSHQNGRSKSTHFLPTASASASSSVGNAEYTEEPATSIKFYKYVELPDCSSSLLLLGTGFREKVFAIIGVKVYAAGLYVNPSLLNDLSPWKGKPVAQVEQDLAVFQAVYQSSLEKSLQIVLVRDIDGKTFWDALDEAVSPRVATPTPVDELALSTFRSIFQGQSLKKGTSILLTWPEASKMLVSVSSDGLPLKVDATIESMNVARALFDVFFGESPVSPTLKASVASGLASTL